MAIQLKIGLNAIASYKRLAYQPWYAIAEFVDNSTQSFFDNEEYLRDLASSTTPLTVSIEYNREADLLRISDNAMGMSLDELEYAMRVAEPPRNTTGRSKYGMGLKTAAAWLGNIWTIRTKKLYDTIEYVVTIDVNKIANGDNNLEIAINNNQSQDAHYTVIEITHLNRKFYTRTISHIGKYLSSIYRLDLSRDVLTLFWQNEKLIWSELDDRSFLRDRRGDIYKKGFEFSIRTEDQNGNPVDKHVHGWIGILSEGSRSKAGFSILHSGRVIKGWPDAWRPESLYGQIQGSNDLVNQRLVGEINLDDFDVSHTKDDILWLGEEQDKVETKLREKCGDYRETARTYRKHSDDERGPSESAVQTAIDKLKRELTSPEMADWIGSDPFLPEDIVEQVVVAVKESIAGIPATFHAEIEGTSITGYIDKMSPNDPYLTIDSARSDEVVIIVNMSHPHWNQLKGSDGVLNFLRHCTYDGISEARARDRHSRSARLNPDTVKLLKDRLLRIPFEIEQNNMEPSEFGEDME